MRFLVAIVTLAVATVAKAEMPTYLNFTNCVRNSADFQVDNFTVNPFPLCPGKNVCFTVTGKLLQDIRAPATLTIVGKYFGTTAYTDAYNMCALLAAHGSPCPVPSTVTSLNFCFPVKSNTPIPLYMKRLESNVFGASREKKTVEAYLALTVRSARVCWGLGHRRSVRLFLVSKSKMNMFGITIRLRLGRRSPWKRSKTIEYPTPIDNSMLVILDLKEITNSVSRGCWKHARRNDITKLKWTSS
ncbi:hypothetical protein BGX26_006647 [Mortierella sp. AD094]|nr:hypothetical protein BGX26_006647 [Mortierella sp. AD094]